MIPVILSGGSGTRLWPLSRKHYPKQLLPLVGQDKTMLQQTIERCSGFSDVSPIIVCNKDHRFLVGEQIEQIGIKHSGIILEPVARNTAPAIALAALHAVNQGNGEKLLLVLPADHVIGDVAAFEQSVSAAKKQAEQGKIVTFGIVPSHPETGFGYIHRGASISGGETTFTVSSFVEKPDMATAQKYLESGEYYWNSGMFLFKANSFIDELKRLQPDILEYCSDAITNSSNDLDFIRVNEEDFSKNADISVDYAIMEKTNNAVVVAMDAKWNDVGSWSALWDVHSKTAEGNSIHGDVIVDSTSNCYLHSTSRLITTVGVNDLVVVETPDAILVADKSKVQGVKNIVNSLKSANRPEVEQHREVYRPWGKYDSVDAGDRYQVKRITVKPGGKLSIQMHHHRAEHWIVVSGTAKVLKGETEQIVSENQSVYIPIGEIHALENPGKVPLELIEVQSGSYLGEDDIVRIEDRYGRV